MQTAAQSNHSYIQINTLHQQEEQAKGKGKGKAIPLQVWTVPEGFRRLRLPDFKTVGT